MDPFFIFKNIKNGMLREFNFFKMKLCIDFLKIFELKVNNNMERNNKPL